MLSDAQLQHRCLLYQSGSQCRYLTESDPKNYAIHDCVKKLPALKKAADEIATKVIQDAKKRGINPLQVFMPCGDGGTCSGYLYLPTVLQGYDVKKP